MPDAELRRRVGTEDTGQLQAFQAATHHMMYRFKLRKQGAVKYPGQHGAAKRAGDLGHDIGQHFSAREAGKQPQGDGDGGVQMPPRNAGRQVHRQRNTQSPDNTDLPQPQAGASQLQSAQAADTKKQK